MNYNNFLEKIQIAYFILLEKTICNFFGHKLKDESTAGPDSGNVSMICERCHRDWTTNLY